MQLRHDLDALGRAIADMSKADEIANAVADEISRRRRRTLTVPRKLVATIAAGILLVPAVHNAFAWWGLG